MAWQEKQRVGLQGFQFFGFPVVFSTETDGKVYLITSKAVGLVLATLPEHIRRAELTKEAKKCGVILGMSERS